MRELKNIIKTYCAKKNIEMFSSGYVLDVDRILIEHILHLARCDIKKLTGFDIMDNGTGAIYIGNDFMYRSFECSKKMWKLLTNKLEEKNILKTDMSIFAKFLLDELRLCFDE